MSPVAISNKKIIFFQAVKNPLYHNNNKKKIIKSKEIIVLETNRYYNIIFCTYHVVIPYFVYVMDSGHCNVVVTNGQYIIYIVYTSS